MPHTCPCFFFFLGVEQVCLHKREARLSASRCRRVDRTEGGSLLCATAGNYLQHVRYAETLLGSVTEPAGIMCNVQRVTLQHCLLRGSLRVGSADQLGQPRPKTICK